jgi:hypothetical protein
MSNTKLFKNSYFKLPKVHHSQLYHFSFKTHNYFNYIESFPAQLEGNYAEALQNYYNIGLIHTSKRENIQKLWNTIYQQHLQLQLVLKNLDFA